MIKVEGRNLYRGGVKIGYVGNGYVMDHTAEKIGFYSLDRVFDKNRHPLAHVEGEFMYFAGTMKKERIEDVEKEVVGGALSNIEKAAVRILLGE